jgi:hypothetical protein
MASDSRFDVFNYLFVSLHSSIKVALGDYPECHSAKTLRFIYSFEDSPTHS